MALAPGRDYRIVYYASSRQVLSRTIRLLWAWDWRYGLDPVWECRQAGEARQNLMDRARQLADQVNAEIASGTAPQGRRWTALGQDDLVDAAARHAIWQDLINVQLSIAMLSALAVKASIEALGKREG